MSLIIKFKSKYVECYDCQHLIRREVAHVVITEGGTTLYYCPKDKKPYSKARYKSGSYLNSFFWCDETTLVGLKEFEVTEQGEPVGYVKAPTEKSTATGMIAGRYGQGSLVKPKAHKKHVFKKECNTCHKKFKGLKLHQTKTNHK